MVATLLSFSVRYIFHITVRVIFLTEEANKSDKLSDNVSNVREFYKCATHTHTVFNFFLLTLDKMVLYLS